MTEPKEPLPDFLDPPLVEVALSVQFEPLTVLRSPQIGLLWAAFRDRFPKTEEHPPLPSVIEKFGPAETNQSEVKVEILPGPPLSRFWFLADKGTELIQIQQDRFVHNWRKIDAKDTYPRYSHVRKTFETALGVFEAFLNKEKVGAISPNQCEITYVNQIFADEHGNTHNKMGEVLSILRPNYKGLINAEAEDCRIASRFIIREPEKGEILGRLHLSVVPAYKLDDKRPIFIMTLTARGKPCGKGVEGVFRFLDIGHEHIVRGFAALTTDRMHGIWRRQNGK